MRISDLVDAEIHNTLEKTYSTLEHCGVLDYDDDTIDVKVNKCVNSCKRIQKRFNLSSLTNFIVKWESILKEIMVGSEDIISGIYNGTHTIDDLMAFIEPFYKKPERKKSPLNLSYKDKWNYYLKKDVVTYINPLKENGMANVGSPINKPMSPLKVNYIKYENWESNPKDNNDTKVVSNKLNSNEFNINYDPDRLLVNNPYAVSNSFRPAGKEDYIENPNFLIF